jgi:hypothetical protein
MRSVERSPFLDHVSPPVSLSESSTQVFELLLREVSISSTAIRHMDVHK